MADGVGDTFSCGLINVATNVLSFIIALIVTPLVDEETQSSNFYTFFILFINQVLGLICLIAASIFSKREASRIRPS